MQIYNHAYIHIIKITQSCYVISHFHTRKISSLELMIKHEQLDLNYSTNTLFHKNYFFRTLFLGIVKPLITIPGKSPIVGSLCEPEFHGHFRPYTHQRIIYSINYHINTQISPQQTRTDQKCLKIFPQFGPMFWDRSNDPSPSQTNRKIIKHLNKL